MSAPVYPFVSSPASRTDSPSSWQDLPAHQQPDWDAHPFLTGARTVLGEAAPVTSGHDTRQLDEALQAVAEGHGRVMHVGDCAESFFECGPAEVSRKLEVLDRLAAAAPDAGPVVQIGRMGGQFAKPRSAPTEQCRGRTLPVFRGHMVNGETPTPAARRADPRRMLWAYEASRRVTRQVDEQRARRAGSLSGPWISHEALVLDYESCLVRQDRRGPRLASTHLPWIGERTRQLGSAHVELMAEVTNPVGCKLGPDTDADSVTALCERLDPRRQPGHLVLIPRMGADRVTETLPNLVRAVHRRGHRPVWLSDPMHGNTVRSVHGTKTRHLDQMLSEAGQFWRVPDRRRSPSGRAAPRGGRRRRHRVRESGGLRRGPPPPEQHAVRPPPQPLPGGRHGAGLPGRHARRTPMSPTGLRPVSNTSLWVAALRATENDRNDPAFVDPYAPALAGDQYEQSLHLQGPDSDRPLNPLLLRTCFVDAVVTDAVTCGIDQVVVFGAGMDTRAMRLGIPPATTIYELDFPETFAYKEPILDRHGATPSCSRVLVPTDVAVRWEADLRAAGLDPQRPILWLLEGLLLYLSPEQVHALGARISTLSVARSVLCFDCYSAELFRDPAMAAWNEALQAQATAPASTMDDPVEWCTSLGWTAQAFDVDAVETGHCPSAARACRVPGPRPAGTRRASGDPE